MAPQKKRQKERELTPWYGGFIGTIMYELVEEEGMPFYLKITKDNIETVNMVETEEEILIPPAKMPFRLPHVIKQEEVAKVEFESLPKRIIDYIEKYLEVPHDKNLYILAAWIMCTWTKEYYTVTPYIHFIGPKESGKTRGGEVLSKIARRGVQTASPTEASVAYALHHIDVTLFVDEQEQKNLEDQKLVPLLDSGYKRGQYYMRCEGERMNVRDVSWLRTWGFKSFSSRDEYVDMLESRCFTVAMKKCLIKRPYEILRSEVDDLIHDLLCLRVRFFQDGLLRADELVENGLKKQEKLGTTVVPNFEGGKNADTKADTDGLGGKSDTKKTSDNPPKTDPESVSVRANVRLKPTTHKDATGSNSPSSDSLTVVVEGEEGSSKMNIKVHSDCTVFIGSRLEELFLTPLKLAGKVSENLKNQLEKIQKNMLQEKKDDDFFTIESTILSAFLELIDERHEQEPQSTQIAEIANHDIVREKEKMSSSYVTRVMKRLGFGQKRNPKGNKRIWIIDRPLVEQLKKRFVDAGKEAQEAGGLAKYVSETEQPQQGGQGGAPAKKEKSPSIVGSGGLGVSAEGVLEYVGGLDGVGYDELRGHFVGGDLDSVLADLIKRGRLHEFRKGVFRVVEQ